MALFGLALVLNEKKLATMKGGEVGAGRSFIMSLTFISESSEFHKYLTLSEYNHPLTLPSKS